MISITAKDLYQENNLLHWGTTTAFRRILGRATDLGMSDISE